MSETAARPLPTPLPPGSRKLAAHRYHVNVARPMAERPGSWKVYREGRFVTKAAARRWAEGVRDATERASVAYYSAHDGWQSHHVCTLRDSGWSDA